MWDGAEVARWAHNPKVEGSIPSPATTLIINKLNIYEKNTFSIDCSNQKSYVFDFYQFKIKFKNKNTHRIL